LVLLKANEAVLVRQWGGKWRPGFGARDWKVARKEPYLANPFMPHEPVYRLKWQFEGVSEALCGPVKGPLPVFVELALLGAFAWVTWAALFALIPLTLLVQRDVAATLTVVSFLYLNILATLTAVWVWRNKLRLSQKQFAMLAFECVACPPYSANIVRRVAALHEIAEEFTAVAGMLLSQQQVDIVNKECMARIDEQIDAVPEQSQAMAALQVSRKRFSAETQSELD
jgi:hypothetical protein